MRLVILSELGKTFIIDYSSGNKRLYASVVCICKQQPLCKAKLLFRTEISLLGYYFIHYH